MALSKNEKVGLVLGGIAAAWFAMNRGEASAATMPSGGGGGGIGPAPIIVPEGNLPQSAINWYDAALTQLGFAGTFSERLIGFQNSRMHALAPEFSHLTTNTQQAIQSAIATQAQPTSGCDLDGYRY